MGGVRLEEGKLDEKLYEVSEQEEGSNVENDHWDGGVEFHVVEVECSWEQRKRWLKNGLITV